ncbi:MAG: HlyD family secretion protein [Bacteroidota bacterium]|nr:HlyD family secretion protein [Bacteroidota bacterium]
MKEETPRSGKDPQSVHGLNSNQPQNNNRNEDEEPVESVPLYKNFKVTIPLFIVVIGIAIGSWNWYLGMRDYISTDDAYVDANRVSVSAKILGRVDSLMTDEGDTVREGETLVKIDDTDLRAQEAQARAALALAEESISLAKVSLDKAQTDFQRTSTQFKENIVPKEQFDNTQSELESARARYNIAVAQVGTARAQLGVIESQIKNTVIQSPMSGVISKRWILPGDVVQPGQPIFSIYDLDNLWITANLEETNLAALHVNDSVEVSIDSYPNRKFTGTVFQIGSNTASQFSLIPPNNASGNFTKVTQRVPVKISIYQVVNRNQDPVQLLPGMSAEVKVKVH